MATLTVTISDFTLSSSWVATEHPQNDPSDPYQGQTTYSTPTTGHTTKTLDLSDDILAGSTITSAVLSGSTNGAGDSKAKSNGVSKNITNNFSVSVKSWLSDLTSFDNIPIVFSFQAYGGTGLRGTQSRSSSFYNIKLVVNYTLPSSTATLDKSTVVAGEDITITISPNQTGVTHTVTWGIEGADAEHTYSDVDELSAGVTTCALTVPEAWMNAFPDTALGNATAVLTTIKDGSTLGAVTLTFKISCPSTAAPTIGSFTASPVGLDGTSGAPFSKYVQNNALAHLVSADCVGKFGATIAGYAVSGNEWSGTGADVCSNTLSKVGDVTFTLVITDSRGMTSTTTATVTVIAYREPYYTALSVQRCQSDGTPSDMGTYLKLSATFACASVDGSNSVTAKYKFKKKPNGVFSTYTAITSGTPAVFGDNAITDDGEYLVVFEMLDGVKSVVINLDVPSAKFLLTGLPNVGGAAFGKVATLQNKLDLGSWSLQLGAQTLDETMIAWLSALSGGIYDWSSTSSGGYIRFGKSTGGVVLQWKHAEMTDVLAAVGDVYYANVTMDNWLIAMTTLYATLASLKQNTGTTSLAGWVGSICDASITDAGKVRIFAASATATNRVVTEYAIGAWSA